MVPFRTAPPPVWPEPCRCCWSPFEGPGLFPSIQRAACPYPSAAPTDSRSTKESDGDRELSEASTVRIKTRSVTTQEGRRSRPGFILHTGSLRLRLTSRRRSGGRVAAVIVFSGFLFDQCGVRKTHKDTGMDTKHSRL